MPFVPSVLHTYEGKKFKRKDTFYVSASTTCNFFQALARLVEHILMILPPTPLLVLGLPAYALAGAVIFDEGVDPASRSYLSDQAMGWGERPVSSDPETLFHMNEGALPLDVPGTWEDKTLHVLRLPGHGHAAASFVISREMLPLGKDVPSYVADELKRMADMLPEFLQMGSVRIDWPDMAGEAIMSRWKSDEGVMDQIICCRPAGGRRLLIFTATHPTPMPGATYHAMIAAITGFRPRAALSSAANS